MELASRLDDYGKPAWITLMVLGFILFWPVGLAILGFLIWSGRMGCWRYGGPGRWYDDGNRKTRRSGRRRHRRGREAQQSGNVAFDEYRDETLRRLEDEQRAFVDFLESLRHAKDKVEFDQFMAERRDMSRGTDDPDRPDGPAPAPQA